MTKKNQYYKLIEYVQKNNIAKVFNFRTNKVEEYLTVMTKKEKLLQKQRRLKQSMASKEVKPVSTVINNQSDSTFLIYKSINYYSNLYRIYESLKIGTNSTMKSIILRRYLKVIKDSFYCSPSSDKFDSLYLKGNFKNIFLFKNSYQNHSLNLINVYVILRRGNIYVTITENDKTIKIFSPCLFSHIPKRGKKKSMSFFYTIKRTTMYITRFFFNKQKKYFLKVFFKGFQKFRRPLLSRFFFNKRLKSRCIGIFNIDSEPFNGCRLRKSKRMQVRGQRKQKKRFSF